MCFFNHSTVTIRPQFRVIRDGSYKWVDATPPRELTVNEEVPSSEITVNVSPESGGDLRVDRTALTFDASDWNIS
ncbi:MAG: hypothetical protein ISN29_01350 [Gammaproteobacteria bacterium AqS3]|nr:hypothetical protein [Gammaproteobacteria bacterium AqS3]